MIAVPQIVDARVVRHEQDGRTWFPVKMADGSTAGLEQLGTWAHVPDLARPAGVSRRLRLVLADEQPLRGGGPMNPPRGWVQRLTGLRWPPYGCPLTFHGTGLAVGFIQAIEHRRPGATPGAVGHHIVAIATLADTILGGIAAHAIGDGHFRGLCPVLLNVETIPEERLLVGGDLVAVQLADLASVCCPGGRVIEWWQERAA